MPLQWMPVPLTRFVDHHSSVRVQIFVIGTEEDLEYGDDDDNEGSGSGSDSEFNLLHGASDEYITEEESEDERDETSMGSEGNAAFRDTVLHVHGSIRRVRHSTCACKL